MERCHGVKWYARKKSNGIYAMGSMKGGKKVFLHRFIMDYYGKLDVDHINRNTLDNRKANLRIMEHYRNSANNASTGIKRTPAGRYQALICFRGKTIYLGTFDSAEEAAMVRREKKRELFNI